MANQNERGEVPVYKYNFAYAAKHGEKEKWKASYQANVKCKQAIEKAINDNYESSTLHTDIVLAEISEHFCRERITYVLANTIKLKLHDERISSENKAWANTVPVALNTKSECYQYDFALEKTHPLLIDAFATQFRVSQI